MGATLAELALPASATPSQRRLFFAAGIIAANLPDADLVYTRITAVPLGYMLHHRGHTHTVAGLVAQAALIGAICMLPAIRDRIGALRSRLAILVGLALASHLLLDSWNSYGVHPFWPLSNAWLYGDAIFIAEPWLWVLLGVAAVMNAHSTRTRFVVGGLLLLLASALTWSGMVGIVTLGVLGLGAFATTMALVRLAPRARSATALAATAVFVSGMFFASASVKQRAVNALPRGRTTEIVDVVLNPAAANPLCWSALAIVKDESAGEFVMTRGSVSLNDRIDCRSSGSGRIQWSAPLRQSLVDLRALVQANCWARAWMQFGRAPVIGGGQISDLRFGDGERGNFTTTPLGNAGCPARLTNWSPPREDLL